MIKLLFKNIKYYLFIIYFYCYFFFSSRRRHTRSYGDWSSDVCSSDLEIMRSSGAAGVGEPRVELPVPIQLPQVLGARDRERDERRAQRGVPQLVVADAVARLGERLVIAHQRRPVGELAIVARLEAEYRARRWDAGRGGGRGPAAGRGRSSGRGRAVLRPARRGQRNGGERAQREQRNVPHGGAKISRRAPSDHRRQGSLCSSTRRFCARPAAVLLGAT